MKISQNRYLGSKGFSINKSVLSITTFFLNTKNLSLNCVTNKHILILRSVRINENKSRYMKHVTGVDVTVYTIYLSLVP